MPLVRPPHIDEKSFNSTVAVIIDYMKSEIQKITLESTDSVVKEEFYDNYLTGYKEAYSMIASLNRDRIAVESRLTRDCNSTSLEESYNIVQLALKLCCEQLDTVMQHDISHMNTRNHIDTEPYFIDKAKIQLEEEHNERLTHS